MKQVIQREEDAGLAQRRRHLEDVAPQRLDARVQRLGHAVDAEVHLDRRVGEPAGHFFGHEEVVGAGMAVQELEAPVDAVVIGDGDEIHAARFGDAVDVLGPRIAIAASGGSGNCRSAANGTSAREVGANEWRRGAKGHGVLIHECAVNGAV